MTTTRHVLALAAGFWFAGLLCAVCFADAAPGRTLTGELVITDPSAHRFRIVGQNGSFTAPAGTPIESLDGHTVQVEVATHGTVTQITEVPVPIQPVTHGWSTVEGQLVVTDAAAQRFTFVGDGQTYVAPPSTNVAAYAGKMVEITLDEDGQVVEFRPLPSPQRSLNTLAVSSSCNYRGATYSAGAAICQAGTQYRCDGNQWQSVGVVCEEGRGVSVSPESPRSCVVGDATVASGSGVCRDGSTFRCDDGAWINARTACR